jgi:formylglycine-generating enzyme required for sulfatase activity
VSEVKLDTYLVTVGRFRQFVRAWETEGWTPDAGAGKHAHLHDGGGLAAGPNVDTGQTYEPGWSAGDDSNVSPTDDHLDCEVSMATWTPSVGGQEGLPINCVNWYEAYAFCIWDGGFLPSEAEWEYAAAGGADQREYPWGATAPGVDDSYAVYGCHYPAGAPTCSSSVANVAPVGITSAGAGRWGQLDLAGELFEWTLDWYGSPYVNPCVDCAYLWPTSGRVMKGGYFLNVSSALLPPDRASIDPTHRTSGLGFRCARVP